MGKYAVRVQNMLLSHVLPSRWHFRTAAAAAVVVLLSRLWSSKNLASFAHDAFAFLNRGGVINGFASRRTLWFLSSLNVIQRVFVRLSFVRRSRNALFPYPFLAANSPLDRGATRRRHLRWFSRLRADPKDERRARARRARQQHDGRRDGDESGIESGFLKGSGKRKRGLPRDALRREIL